MITKKQCGNCEFWDLAKVKKDSPFRISTCNSTDIRADSFLEVGRNLFEKDTMFEESGEACVMYKERW